LASFYELENNVELPAEGRNAAIFEWVLRTMESGSNSMILRLVILGEDVPEWQRKWGIVAAARVHRHDASPLRPENCEQTYSYRCWNFLRKSNDGRGAFEAYILLEKLCIGLIKNW
jgi:hypothetical protein